MRTNLEHHFAVPICVALLVGRDRSPLANLDNPREQEILEHLVVLTKGARMPAEAVEGQRVRLDPARAGLWS